MVACGALPCELGKLMRWPWQRHERPARHPFTDAVIQAIVAGAESDAGHGGHGSGYAGLLGAQCPEPNPTRRGPALDRGPGRHRPAVSLGFVDVRGDDDPSTWLVRADLFGPSGNRTVFRRHAAFIHARYAVDPARPWYGIGRSAGRGIPGRWRRTWRTISGRKRAAPWATLSRFPLMAATAARMTRSPC